MDATRIARATRGHRWLNIENRISNIAYRRPPPRTCTEFGSSRAPRDVAGALCRKEKHASHTRQATQIAIRSLHGPFEITMILGFHVGAVYD